MKGLSLKLASGLIIALMALSAVGYPIMALAENTTTTTAAPSTTQGASALAAKMYINKISLFINKTLELAEKYNITIPENLTDNIETAKSLIAEAENALENGDIGQAIVYATKASNTFIDVAIYVWKQISPEERQGLKQERLINAVEARIMALHRVQVMIQKLEMAGVQVDMLKNLTVRINQTLQQALEYARQGNLSVARQLMLQAEKQFGLTLKATYKLVNTKLHAVTAAASAMKGLNTVLSRITTHLNMTIQFIEEGRYDEALVQLNNTEEALTNLANALSRIKDAMVRQGVNETYIEAVDILLNATNTSAIYINESITALEANDTNTSIMYITMAINELTTAIEKVNETGLPQIIRKELRVLRGAAEKVRRAIIWDQARLYSAISVHVDREKAKLELLIQKYNNGEITRVRLLIEAGKTYRHMVMIKQSLDDRAPNWLIQKIDAFLNWIKTNIPGVVKGGSGPGGHGGQQGGMHG
ncbi:MAG: hypothetical protein F7B19_01520 [Desulfurococcales archaeon]|nr:hypothetical protein [Desulfurococcales archaeon]